MEALSIPYDEIPNFPSKTHNPPENRSTLRRPNSGEATAMAGFSEVETRSSASSVVGNSQPFPSIEAQGDIWSNSTNVKDVEITEKKTDTFPPIYLDFLE
ncbi:hypothetical protein LINPERHAP2_LOCUS23825 [Linum perenne]